jgi:Winged helix-turn-helix domain (DUF2582)
MMDEIGDCAGKVWRYLEEHGDSSAEEVTKALKLKESLASLALGWLAREDKLEIEQVGKTLKLSLK